MNSFQGGATRAISERGRITIAIPSLNQGSFIAGAVESVLRYSPDARVNVLDGGSSDNTLEQLRPLQPRLSRFRSRPDDGQAAAINEGLEGATTAFVAWLNADDEYLPGGLERLEQALEAHPTAPFAYGRTRLEDADGRVLGEYAVEPWNRHRFARKCFISQPSTLIRTIDWNRVGGLDAKMHMALDYDLWWRLTENTPPPQFVDHPVALARFHPGAKTMRNPIAHYREAMATVKRHYGKVPLWWWLKMPASIGARALFGTTIGTRNGPPA